MKPKNIKVLKPFTQEASVYLDLFCPLVDEIITTDYTGMSAEGQQNIDTLAYMIGESPGCYVVNPEETACDVWDAKYDEPKD